MIKIEAFYTKNEDFDQKYLNTGSKTQNVEDLSLDLIFHDNLLSKIKKISKQNSKLRINSKPDINQSKLTVCSVESDLKKVKVTPIKKSKY